MYPVAYSLKWGFWEGKALQTNIQLMEGMSNRVLEGTNGELNYGLIAVWSWDELEIAKRNR